MRQLCIVLIVGDCCGLVAGRPDVNKEEAVYYQGTVGGQS